MSRCPQCGSEELQEIHDSGNAICMECGDVVEPAGTDEGEAWCDACGDFRTLDGDGRCNRCGADVDGE